MPRKRKLLNVVSHLEHAKIILDGINEFGMCPAIEEELKRFRLFNDALLRKVEGMRAKGNRKDLTLS